MCTLNLTQWWWNSKYSTGKKTNGQIFLFIFFILLFEVSTSSRTISSDCLYLWSLYLYSQVSLKTTCSPGEILFLWLLCTVYIYFCSTSSLKTLRFFFFFPSMGLSKEKIIKVSFTETVFIEWWQLATPIIQLGHEETKGTPLKINPLGRYQ